MSISKEVFENLACLAFEEAHKSCDSDIGCKHYHAIWMLARLIKDSSPTLAGSKFIESCIRSYARNNSSPRILVSGAADCLILSVLHSIQRGLEVNPIITVIDRCSTPLTINSKYMEKVGIEAKCFQTDVFDYSSQPHDLIVAHSFLGFIPQKSRIDLFSKWNELLKSGGKIILSNRIEKTNCFRPSSIDNDLIKEKIANLVSRASEVGFSVDSLSKIEKSAELVWAAPSTPEESVTLDEVRLLSEETEFNIESLSFRDRSNEAEIGPLASAYRPSGKRAEILLSKI